MARIEFSHQETREEPHSVECIEVRPWNVGGAPTQQFMIGSGANFDATSVVWLEIAYRVNDAQVFYTRNFLHHFSDFSAVESEKSLEKFERKEQDAFGFGGMLPETSLTLTRKNVTIPYPDGTQNHFDVYELEISMDTGAIFGGQAPGEVMIKIFIREIAPDVGIQFMRDLIGELDEVHRGVFPDPAEVSDGMREWPMLQQLNRGAYDQISSSYQEKYFENPALSDAFNAWLRKLPTGGHVLDVGCGHGDPVIARLLDKGHQVTGVDTSSKMLEKAQIKYPDVTFLNIPAQQIAAEAEFDGACSLSSMLYLDPIDLAHSLYRLYRAIKPGGWLFLYGIDVHPTWRGIPYKTDIDQWMWSWTYNIQEATALLEQHGRFKVIESRDVTTAKEKIARLKRWRVNVRKQLEDMRGLYPPGEMPAFPSIQKKPNKLAYDFYILAQRQPVSCAVERVVEISKGDRR